MINSLVFVELAPGEPPVRVLVVDEMTDVGVHLGEDEGDVVAEADFPAPDGLDGRRAALVIVCEEKGNIIKGKSPSS